MCSPLSAAQTRGRRLFYRLVLVVDCDVNVKFNIKNTDIYLFSLYLHKPVKYIWSFNKSKVRMCSNDF